MIYSTTKWYIIPGENEKFEVRQQALSFLKVLLSFDQFSHLLFFFSSFLVEGLKVLKVLAALQIAHRKGIFAQFPLTFLTILLSHFQETSLNLEQNILISDLRV